MADNHPGKQMMVLFIMLIVLVMIIGAFFVWQLVAPPLVSTAQSANSALAEAMQSSGDANMQSAHASSFAPASQSLNNLEWLSYTIFIMMFLTFILMCFYVRSYPFLAIFWIILVVILFICSLYITTVYQDLATDDSLGYTSWETTDFMLKNLPIIVFVVGIVSGIVMFMIAGKDKEVEGYSLPL